MITKLKKPRKKKSHFKTGVHISVKCKNGPAKYRSGWEKIVCEMLDFDTNVLYYEYEPFKLQWCSNMKTCRIRTYIPDFLVVYCNGTKKLVEVKSNRFLNSKHVQKKAMIGKSWAQRNNAEYQFWTDQKIAAFKKILQANKKTPVVKKKKKVQSKKVVLVG